MANDYFIGTWEAIQAQAQDGAVLQLKKNDFATIIIEESMFGYMAGRMERKKLFGRVDSIEIVVSETNDPNTIQIMQAFNILLATRDNTNGGNYLKTTWFSNTPYLNGITVMYRKR